MGVLGRLRRSLVFARMVVRVQVRVGMAVNHIAVTMLMDVAVAVRMLMLRHVRLHSFAGQGYGAGAANVQLQ
jgi:hypothetical protein